MNTRLNAIGKICCIPVILLLSAQTLAADSQSTSDWEFGAAVYMWGANITADTSSGSESQIPFYKLLDDLQMAFMGAFEARKDKWSIMTDAIYMDVKDKANTDIGYPGVDDITVNGSVELKAWVVSPTVRYAVRDTEKARFELLGGLRYLYLDAITSVYFDQTPVLDAEDSGSNWDFVVGANAEINLNDHWYMPLYADVGFGDSKSTWQGMAGIGYRFNRFNAMLTYRYLSYDFDNDSPLLSKMTMKGPLAGVTFRF